MRKSPDGQPGLHGALTRQASSSSRTVRTEEWPQRMRAGFFLNVKEESTAKQGTLGGLSVAPAHAFFPFLGPWGK